MIVLQSFNTSTGMLYVIKKFQLSDAIHRTPIERSSHTTRNITQKLNSCTNIYLRQSSFFQKQELYLAPYIEQVVQVFMYLWDLSLDTTWTILFCAINHMDKI